MQHATNRITISFVLIYPALFRLIPWFPTFCVLRGRQHGESGKNGKASDTMGTKNRVGFGLYVFKGSINCQLAEKTGFSDEDAEKIKKALVTLFENDCSSARPEGSMQVCRVYWWKHDGKTPKVSSAKIHNAVQIKEKAELNGKEPNSVEDYDIVLNNPEGAVQPEIIDNI